MPASCLGDSARQLVHDKELLLHVHFLVCVYVCAHACALLGMLGAQSRVV